MGKMILLTKEDLELIREAREVYADRYRIDQLYKAARTEFVRRIIGFHVERVYFRYEENAIDFS